VVVDTTAKSVEAVVKEVLGGGEFKDG